MKADLIEFERGIRDLTKAVQYLKVEGRLLKLGTTRLPDTPIRSLLKKYQRINQVDSSLRRRFNYNSVIVSLYGLLEQYIEALIASYVSTVNSFTPCVESIPEDMMKHHLRVSMDFITRVQQHGYSGYATPEEIIRNLYSCVEGRDFKLNSEAFSLHTANFREATIDELFRTVGIPSLLNDVCQLYLFRKQFAIEESGEIPVKLDREEAFAKLNDLVSRRNQVSHGVSSDILDLDILQGYIAYIYYFGISLFKALEGHLLKLFVATIDDAVVPTDVFMKGRVICFHLEHEHLSTKSKILAFNHNRISVCDIVEIKINDDIVASVSPTEKLEVGAKLDKPINKKHKIKVLPDKLPW